MFAKTRRNFQPGTFIPTPPRVAAIVHLCFAFTVLISYIGYPYMGELFAIKERKIQFESVMGISVPQNKERFATLPDAQKQDIEQAYAHLLQRTAEPFLAKLARSFSILAVAVPPFEQAWILFSVLIPILVLMKVEGAAASSWILPLLVIAYAWSNISYGVPPAGQAMEQFFPKESEIIALYLKEPLSSSIKEQMTQLEKGWHLYLIEKWAGQNPSSDPVIFQSQLDSGRFAFEAARAETLARTPPPSDNTMFNRRVSPVLLLGYLAWNLFFAYYLNLKKWRLS